MDKIVLNTVLEMAETHLTNVQQEITKLEASKVKIDEQISTYNKYLTDSVEAIRIVRKEMQDEPVNTPTPSNNIVQGHIQGLG